MGAQQPGDVIKLFDKLFNSGDIDGLMEIYEDGVVMPGQGSPEPIQGKAGTREALKAFIDSGAKLRFGASIVLPAGDIALTHNSWTMDNADGTSMEGATAEVVRRQPDGTWKYIVDNPFGSDLLKMG